MLSSYLIPNFILSVNIFFDHYVQRIHVNEVVEIITEKLFLQTCKKRLRNCPVEKKDEK